MLYMQTKAITDAHRPIWQYIFHIFLFAKLNPIRYISVAEMNGIGEGIFSDRSRTYEVNFEMETLETDSTYM